MAPDAAMTTAVTAPAGAAIADLLQRAGEPVRPPLRFEPVAGGRSNLTYRVTDADRRQWILRRPPLSGVVASAHDVLREYRVMLALRDSPVPVPRTVLAHDGPNPFDAPFYVMEFVDGFVLADEATAQRELTPGSRRQAGTSIVDLLVSLHAVVPADVGLAALGRGDDFVPRQLRRWQRQLDLLDADRPAVLDDLRVRLGAAPPVQRATTIVHGDFRPANMILGRDGRIRALLDWELCTLGDPLVDLGWLLAYWGSPDDPVRLPLAVPTRAAGFPTRADVITRYAAASGRDVSDVPYYTAFALWRLGVILAGVRARNRAGAYGSAGADDLSERVAMVAEAAQAAARVAGL